MDTLIKIESSGEVAPNTFIAEENTKISANEWFFTFRYVIYSFYHVNWLRKNNYQPSTLKHRKKNL